MRSCLNRLISDRTLLSAALLFVSRAEGFKKVNTEASMAESRANTTTAILLLENVSTALRDEHNAVRRPVIM